MQKLFFSFLVFLIACNSKLDDEKNDENKNTDYLVSLDGIGPFKVSMKQAELEKLLNQKVPLTNPTDTISGSWEDSASIKYKDIEIKLHFVRTYEDADSFYMRITRMLTSSTLCKTQNNISIGSAKKEIVDAFENYLLIMAPDYADTSYTTRSKTHYSIKVREDWEGRQIVFYLKNNKVYKIEVGSFYDDSE